MNDSHDKQDADSDDEKSRKKETTESSSLNCPSRNNASNPHNISSSPISSFLFSGMAASPPQFVSLEQIMTAAKGVTNMFLCHEIAVNQDFKLSRTEPEEKGLEKQVKDIVHKAFWDLLTEELQDDPPRYDQAMVLLNDVKEGLLSLLIPEQARLIAHIKEVLDIELIRQQAEHGVLDVQHCAAFVVSLMGRMCAPVRDERIKELSQITEVVPLFRGILELLDQMKLDLANFRIQQIRPTIQQHSVDYERTKFREFLQAQAAMFPQVDGLEFTRHWLRRNYLGLTSSGNEECTTTEGGKNIYGRTLSRAYLELLEWNDAFPFPESLVIDQGRFMELGDRFLVSCLVGSLLLVALSLSGPDLQVLASFKERLKKCLILILQDSPHQLRSETELEDRLQNVYLQIKKELNDCLTEKGLPQLTAENSLTLREQVLAVGSSQHRVRALVRGRILSFLEEAITCNVSGPIQIPPGLSSLQSELSHLAGQFIRLVEHNKAVFQDFYRDIVEAFVLPSAAATSAD